MLRQEAAIGSLQYLVAIAMGNKTVKPEDFMPYARDTDDDPDRVATPEDVMRLFGVKKHG